MFDLITDNPGIVKGELHQVILEFGDTPNADIQYYVGYSTAEGMFIPTGISTEHIDDKEGEFTNFMVRLQLASSIATEVLAVLNEKLVAKVPEVIG